jgi:hypothetical protein
MEKMITVPPRHAFRMMDEGPGGAVSRLFRLCRMDELRGILHNRERKKGWHRTRYTNIPKGRDEQYEGNI